jgi:type VI secretion system Hcp family effector
MPVKAEIKILDRDGKELPGPRDNGSSLVYEFKTKVHLPIQYENVAGMAAPIVQQRIREEFVIVKEIDQLTPQFYKAVTNNEQWKKVTITLYRINPTGGDEEPYFEFLLEEVVVTSVENYMPLTIVAENEEMGHLEKVSFLPDRITWTYIPGMITVSDESLELPPIR